MSKPRRKSRTKRPTSFATRFKYGARRYLLGALVLLVCFVAFSITLYSVMDPIQTPYMRSERDRIGYAEQDWVPIENIAPVMARSVVAAEDADFCRHWGLDLNAIRAAMEDGGSRGGSTISQQVVKNVYLWQGRSWFRKLLEAGATPLVELTWSKRRILEVYLNVAEFDEGIFGIQAAAVSYFGVDAADLTAVQAARLAAVLPSPKTRNASNPSDALRRRASQIMDGAATIEIDGRASCFEATSS